MNRMIRFRLSPALIAASLALVSAGAARAQNENAGAPGDGWPPVRSARTPRARRASSPPPTTLSMMWNPAGLALMDQDQVSFGDRAAVRGHLDQQLRLRRAGSRLPASDSACWRSVREFRRPTS